jgi:PadR family transcriptional regulator, regulatory protein PadR
MLDMRRGDIDSLCEMTFRDAIPSGTLDMLILKTLGSRGELHGFEIAEIIEQRSADVLRVEEGSLYPSLQRMLIKGWIAGEWGRTPENRRARYYHVTAAGRRQLETELAAYKRVSAAIARILQPS